MLQLQSSSEERMSQIEALTQDVKAAQKEVGRLRPLEQRVRDLVNEAKQQQSARDRYNDACQRTCHFDYDECSVAHLQNIAWYFGYQ